MVCSPASCKAEAWQSSVRRSGNGKNDLQPSGISGPEASGQGQGRLFLSGHRRNGGECGEADPDYNPEVDEPTVEPEDPTVPEEPVVPSEPAE